MVEPQGTGPEQRYGQGPPKPFYRRKGCCLSLVIVALLLLLALVAGIAVLVAWNRGGREHTIRFEAGGTSQAVSVNYGTAGDFSRLDTKPPWSRTQKVRGWNAATLTVTNRTGSGGVECKLYVDGELRQSSSTDAPYGVASCNTAVSGPIGQAT